MNNSKEKNPNIRCTVQQCRHNCGAESFCSLDQVSIGTHEPNPTQPKCVDCNSFECGGECCR